MQIVRDVNYLNELDYILEYIAQDSYIRAETFLIDLDTKIDNLENFPYKFRQSFHYNSVVVRDLIYKGYTIPYFIDEDTEKIIILDIFKWINKS